MVGRVRKGRTPEMSSSIGECHLKLAVLICLFRGMSDRFLVDEDRRRETTNRIDVSNIIQIHVILREFFQNVWVMNRFRA